MITEIERKLNLVRESIKELSFEIRHLEESKPFDLIKRWRIG